jgi:hypothetical protein
LLTHVCGRITDTCLYGIDMLLCVLADTSVVELLTHAYMVLTCVSVFLLAHVCSRITDTSYMLLRCVSVFLLPHVCGRITYTCLYGTDMRLCVLADTSVVELRTHVLVLVTDTAYMLPTCVSVLLLTHVCGRTTDKCLYVTDTCLGVLADICGRLTYTLSVLVTDTTYMLHASLGSC